jgi:hypothetical protein
VSRPGNRPGSLSGGRGAARAGDQAAYTGYQDLSKRYVAELKKPRIRLGSALGLLGAAGVGPGDREDDPVNTAYVRQLDLTPCREPIYQRRPPIYNTLLSIDITPLQIDITRCKLTPA